ncbi:zinc finger protein 808-like [Uranotaenia lowii]|uniref:zinc finger protein 808-like n=1 Tax=Uranotaenia lowii TaxID=190385 RepID=UPI00247839B1|nr:zinc finger protein 808-like [Uranotaenia lowii]
MSKTKSKIKLKSSSQNRCTICNRTFRQISTLARHEVIFHKILIGRWARENYTAWPNRCTKCGLHFRYNILLPLHNCDDVLNPKANNDQSTETINGRQKFQCSICEKNFDDKPNLDAHIWDMHNGEKSYDCDKCGKSCNAKRKLEDHYARYHIGKPRYQCITCGKKFFFFPAYRNHIKISHLEEYDQTLVARGVRDLPINELYSMDGCVVIDDGPNPLRCEICNKTCTSKKMYDRHKKIAHKKRKWMLACNKCDKVYEKKIFLEDHYACDHLNVIRYACEYCGESFTWRYAYFLHLKKNHSKEYKDSVRGNKTHVISYNKLNLGNDLDEILTNDTLRERSCVMCIRTFISKPQYLEHMQSQHLPKTFDCNRCDKMFNVKLDLELHFAEIHADKPWFRCEICVKNFDSIKEYCLHHKTKHPKEYAEILRQKSCDQLYEMDGFLIVERVPLENHLLKPRDSYEEQNCVTIKSEPPAEEPMGNDDEVSCPSIKSEIEQTDVTVATQQELMSICNYCGKKYRSETDLWNSNHSIVLHQINVHGIFDSSMCRKLKNADDESLSEFQYHCDICEYRFRDKKIYQYHECGMAKEQNTDSKNVKYRCNVCKKIFKYKINLRHHLKIDHQQTGNKCDICEKTVNTKRDLLEHKFNVHFKKPLYRCSLCGETFSGSGASFDHRKKYHSEELERAAKPLPSYAFIERLNK